MKLQAELLVADVLTRYPSKPKGGGRRRRTNVGLGVELLEDRRLMTAAPNDMSQFFAVERSDYGTAAEVCTTAGENMTGLMVLDLHNLGGQTLTPGKLHITGTGTMPLNKVASALDVYVDGNRNGDLFDEAPVASVGIGSNRVVVDMTSVFERYQANGLNAVGFGVQTKPTLATAASIGLDVEKIEVLNAQGKKLRASDVVLLDMNASMLHVVPQENLLFLSVTGPATDQVEKGQQNVALGVIHVSTTQGDVNFSRLSVGIEARDATGALTAKVGQELGGVELYNTRTGQLVAGTLHSQGNGYQVYKFADMIAKDGDSLVVRADTSNHSSVQAGDRYRILVETTEANNSATTLLGLLPKAAKGLDLNVVDVDSRRSVTVVYPQGTLAGNFVRIGQTSMDVRVQYIASADTAVANQKDLTFVRFQIMGRGGDVNFTEAAFMAEQGNLLNGQHYRIIVDTDGDGIVDTPLTGTGFVQNGRLVFNDIVGGGYVIGRDQVVTFELRGDAASSLLPDNVLQAKLVSVAGEKVANGSPVQTSLSSVPSTAWTFVKQGDLIVTKGVSPVPSRQLLGGMLSDPILIIDIQGQKEPIDVNKLGFQSLGGYARSVTQLELYKLGATTPFAIATIGGTGSDPVPAGSTVFTANMQNRQLVVPEGETLTILVRARIKSDGQGGIPGEQVQFQLSRVEARGSDSSNDLLQNDGDNVREGEVFVGTNVGANAPVVSPVHVVAMSKVASIVNANPDADNTNVATNVVAPIGQFRLTAAVNTNTMNGLNRMAIDSWIFTLYASGVTMDASSFFLYNKADSSVQAQGVLRNADGTALSGNVTMNGTYYVEFVALRSKSVNTEIASGQSATFVVSGKTVLAQSGSELQMSMGGFSNPLQTSFGIGKGHIKWFDADTSETAFYGFGYSDTLVRSTKYRNN